MEQNQDISSAERPLRRAHVVFLIAAVITLGLVFGVSAPTDFPKGGIVSIAPGSSLQEVAKTLHEDGFIRSSAAFVTFVTIFGGEHSISSGDYYFAQPTPVFGVAWQISHGRHNLEPVKVTIPEGRNVREIGAILDERLPGFAVDQFVQLATQYEGYLFPETYFFYPKTDPANVLKEMRAMFKTKAEPELVAKKLGGRKAGDIIVMASLIEREARGDDDRSTIAGILYNRLSRGMPLQVDASVAFARGIPEGDIVKSDLSIDSPYNTYVYRGLPPGPISNPGLESIYAAENPTATEYLYYLHDRHGMIHYAKTYAEHQKNVYKYLK